MKNNTHGGEEEEEETVEEEHLSVVSGFSCNDKRREEQSRAENRTWLPLIYYGGNVGRKWDHCSPPANFVLT